MRYSCVGFLLLAGCLASSVPLFAAVEIVDEIVCKVNDQIITRSDLEQDRKELEEQFRTDGGLTGSRLQEEVKKADAGSVTRTGSTRCCWWPEPRNWTSRSIPK